MNDVLHFHYHPAGGDWIKRLMSRLQDSSSPVLRERRQQWATAGLGEFAGAIATKQAMHPLVIKRVNDRIHTLAKILKEDAGGVAEAVRGGYGYRPKDETFTYDLLIDFDAFLFETLSAYDITARFLRTFCFHILNAEITLQDVIEALDAREADTRWIRSLKENRNLFIHETAPWPALRVLDDNRFELVLLKKTVEVLDDPSDYLDFSECAKIYTGFIASFNALESWLMEQIAIFESVEQAPRTPAAVAAATTRQPRDYGRSE